MRKFSNVKQKFYNPKNIGKLDLMSLNENSYNKCVFTEKLSVLQYLE